MIGGTPAGIAFAVRAAREGARVLLVNHTNHLGGMLANGLGVWDTRYERKRAPIYDEVRQAIFDHYRETYGATSQQCADAQPGATGHSNGKFEPHVAETILTRLVRQEAGIEVVLNHYPAAVERTGATIKSVTFANQEGTGRFRATAQVFADCSYEADSFPLAGIPYRVGREARSEFGETHAGVIFMQSVETAPTLDDARKAEAQSALRLRHFGGFQVRRGESTGESDSNVQAMNYRVMLTKDPIRRRPVARPAHYEPAQLRTLEFGAEVAGIPNGKLCLNRPQLPGPHNAYVEGDWRARRAIMDAHWETALAMLWFRQNDSSVPEEERRRWREYGLAGDEFADHHHRPHEIYVREGRRLCGRYLLTQADTLPAAGLARPPLHADSIAFTEWYVDSHACTPRRVSGSLPEGKVMLHQETFPGQGRSALCYRKGSIICSYRSISARRTWPGIPCGWSQPGCISRRPRPTRPCRRWSNAWPRRPSMSTRCGKPSRSAGSYWRFSTTSNPLPTTKWRRSRNILPLAVFFPTTMPVSKCRSIRVPPKYGCERPPAPENSIRWWWPGP